MRDKGERTREREKREREKEREVGETKWREEMLYTPAQRSEPGEFVGMVNSVADVNDLLKTLDLHAHDLQKAKSVKTG